MLVPSVRPRPGTCFAPSNAPPAILLGRQVFQGVNTHSGDNCVIKVLKPVKKKKIKREIK